VADEPSGSLADGLRRLLPGLRRIADQRKVTVCFDRGGWSPDVFNKLINAGLNVLTYRKGAFEPLPDEEFTEQAFTDPNGTEHTYHLAETTVTLQLSKPGQSITLRQICKRTDTGTQIPIIASDTSLPAAQLCWRLAARWRQENYFRYARQHFAIDALDTYADQPDDPDRPVPNPAKQQASERVTAARDNLTQAQASLATALDTAAERAGQSGGTATADPAASHKLEHAREHLAHALADRRTTPAYIPLAQVRPNARLLDEERKLITHAIRMAAYNAETTLARTLAPHYARAEDEARALLREAFTLPGDIEVLGDTLHVRLNPATAPRRSRAIHALCSELTTTQTTYPGTNLKITYSIKGQPEHS
jgi:hypothetical protein